MRPLFLAALLILCGCTSVHTKIEINAPAAAVRAVLFRFEDYPTWNPFIIKVDGVVGPGREVTVTVKPVGKPEISGMTTITSLSDNRLSWRGSLAVPGLFRGEHEFVIEEVGPNKTEFYQNERMSGLIIPFFDFKPEEGGFIAMNEALKRLAEGPPK